MSFGKYKVHRLPVQFEVVHDGAHGGDAFFDGQRNAIVREFLIASLAGQGQKSKPDSRQTESSENSLIQSTTKVTLRRNRDGQGTTWFHPRACMVPVRWSTGCSDDPPGNRGFGLLWPRPLDRIRDGGNTWSDPQAIPSLGRIPVEGQPGFAARRVRCRARVSSKHRHCPGAGARGVLSRAAIREGGSACPLSRVCRPPKGWDLVGAKDASLGRSTWRISIPTTAGNAWCSPAGRS